MPHLNFYYNLATTGLPPPGEILRGISDVLTLSMQEVQERQTAGQNRVEATHKYDQAKVKQVKTVLQVSHSFSTF